MNNFVDVQAIVEQFLSSSDDEETEQVIVVDSKMRHELRQLETLFPTLHYVALGRGTSYALKLSKLPIHLPYQDLALTTKFHVLKLEGINLLAPSAGEDQRKKRNMKRRNATARNNSTRTRMTTVIGNLLGHRRRHRHKHKHTNRRRLTMRP